MKKSIIHLLEAIKSLKQEMSFNNSQIEARELYFRSTKMDTNWKDSYIAKQFKNNTQRIENENKDLFEIVEGLEHYLRFIIEIKG